MIDQRQVIKRRNQFFLYTHGLVLTPIFAYLAYIRLLGIKKFVCISAFRRYLWIFPKTSSYEATVDQRRLVKQRKFNFMQFTPMVDMDLICIHRARIPPESPILLLFGSWWGHLGVLMCFPMFPDLFRVIRVVKFEICQKKSFLGLIPLVNRPYEGGPKWKGKMTLFSTFLAIFQHN